MEKPKVNKYKNPFGNMDWADPTAKVLAVPDKERKYKKDKPKLKTYKDYLKDPLTIAFNEKYK